MRLYDFYRALWRAPWDRADVAHPHDQIEVIPLPWTCSDLPLDHHSSLRLLLLLLAFRLLLLLLALRLSRVKSAVQKAYRDVLQISTPLSSIDKEAAFAPCSSSSWERMRDEEEREKERWQRITYQPRGRPLGPGWLHREGSPLVCNLEKWEMRKIRYKRDERSTSPEVAADAQGALGVRSHTLRCHITTAWERDERWETERVRARDLIVLR